MPYPLRVSFGRKGFRHSYRPRRATSTIACRSGRTTTKKPYKPRKKAWKRRASKRSLSTDAGTRAAVLAFLRSNSRLFLLVSTAHFGRGRRGFSSVVYLAVLPDIRVGERWRVDDDGARRAAASSV